MVAFIFFRFALMRCDYNKVSYSKLLVEGFLKYEVY